MSLIVITDDRSMTQTNQRQKHSKSTKPNTRTASSTQSSHIARVTEYIVGRLRSSSTPLSSPISHASYTSLLPTIWALISATPHTTPVAGAKTNTNRHNANELLHATLDHATKVGSKSSCKRPTIEFVSRLILVRTMRVTLGNAVSNK